MISSFYIKNFRSIAEVKVDFTFGEKKAPNCYDTMERLPFIENGSVRCAPIAAIFGANASGKTNIAAALATIMHIMAGTKNPNYFMPYDPNLLIDCGQETILRLQYAIGGYDCEYEVKFDASGLKSETLICNGVLLFSVKSGQEITFDKSVIMPSPEYNQTMFASAIKAECTDDKGRFVLSFASLLIKRFKGLNDLLKICLLDFANSVLVLDFRPMDLYSVIEDMSIRTGESQESILGEIVSIIRELDIDILDIKFRKYELNETDIIGMSRIVGNSDYRPQRTVIHSFHMDKAGKNVMFDFMFHESDGTKRLATIVARCLTALKTGGTICIDELETSLHPLLVREILNLFKMRSNNSKNAQLIFTTHLVQLLDDAILRLSEIIIVDKNRQTGTKVKRLVDMKNNGEKIRNITNFRKRYLKGYYAGVPKASL